MILDPIVLYIYMMDFLVRRQRIEINYLRQNKLLINRHRLWVFDIFIFIFFTQKTSLSSSLRS